MAKITLNKEGRVAGFLSLVVVVFSILILAVVFSIGPYDRSHQTTIECTVVSARGAVTSGTGRAGSITSDIVGIETSDCGAFKFVNGVTKENKDSIAQKFVPGATYSFTIGKGSRALMKVIDFFDVPVEAYSYERVD